MNPPPAAAFAKEKILLHLSYAGDGDSSDGIADKIPPATLTRASILLGVVFLLGTILHFIPATSPDRMLLGVFHVNPAHNVMNLVSGAAALLCGLASVAAARMFLRVCGIVYGLVAVLGFVQGDALLFGLISNNWADVWLHGVIATASLLLGFGVRGKEGPADGVASEPTAPPAMYCITIAVMNHGQSRRRIRRDRRALSRAGRLRVHRKSASQSRAQIPRRLP
jgi:hypothetical protein